MPRISVPGRDDVHGESEALLNAIAKQLKFVPRLFRTAAISPDALTSMMVLRSAIAQVLDARTLVRIALAVSQVNECQYCLSLHSHLGLNYGGLSPAEMWLNRQGKSSEPKSKVLVAFARSVVENRGKIEERELRKMREIGYDDSQMIAIVTACAYYQFTNLINNVFQTEVDFPKVEVSVDDSMMST